MKIKNKIDPAKLLRTFNVGLISTIVGTCIPEATVNISDGPNTILTVSVNSDVIWSGIISNSLTARHEYIINAIQALGTTINSASPNVSFTMKLE